MTQGRPVGASHLAVPGDARQHGLDIEQSVDVMVEHSTRRALDETVGTPIRPVRPLRPDRDADPSSSQTQAIDLGLRFASHA